MLKSCWQALQHVWQGWKEIAHKIGNFQARVLLSILYGVLVLPFGLAVRVFADPLRIKRLPTGWLEHPNEAHDMKWARRQ